MFKSMRTLQLIAVLLVLVLAVPVFADTYKRSLSLTDPAKLGGTEIKPGEYQLEFDGARVTVKKGRKVVAEAPAEWVDVKAEVRGDTVIIEKGTISEIRIEGRKRVIMIK